MVRVMPLFETEVLKWSEPFDVTAARADEAVARVSPANTYAGEIGVGSERLSPSVHQLRAGQAMSGKAVKLVVACGGYVEQCSDTFLGTIECKLTPERKARIRAGLGSPLCSVCEMVAEMETKAKSTLGSSS